METNNFEIAIITRGRVNDQVTIENLAVNLRKFVVIYSDEDDYEELLTRYKSVVKSVLKCPMRGIGNIRHHILETTTSQVVAFADDDLTFGRREGRRLKEIESNDTESQMAMFQWMCDTILNIPDIAITSVPFITMNREPNGGVKYNQRFWSFWAVSVAKYRTQRTAYKMDKWLIKEDFVTGISMLLRGLRIALNHDYFWRQQLSNQPGGCSIYRNVAMQNEYAKRICEAFPGFVSLKVKKGWGGEMNQPFYDVKINWKKLYECGKG